MQKSRLIFLLLLFIAFSIWSFSALNLNTWKSTNSHQLEKSKHSRKLRPNQKIPLSVRAIEGKNENQQSMKILGFDSDQQRLCTFSPNSANPSSSCLIVSVPSVYEISEEGQQQQQKKSTNDDVGDTSLPFTVRLAKQIIDHQQEDSSSSFNSNNLLTKSSVFRDLRKVLNDHNLGHTLRNRDDVPASVKTWTNYHAKLVQEAKKKNNNKKHNLPLRTMHKMSTENDENDQTTTKKQHISELLMGGSNTPSELNELCYNAVYSSRSNGQASISHLILPKKKQKHHSTPSRSCQSSKQQQQQQLSSSSSFTRSCLNENYPLLFRLLDDNNNQIDDEHASRLESVLCQNCDNNVDEDDYELVSMSSGDDETDNEHEFSAILVVVPHSMRRKHHHHRHHFDESIMKLLKEDTTIQKPIMLCDAFSSTFSMKKNDDWVKFFSTFVSSSSSLDKQLTSSQNSRPHQENNKNLAWFAVPEQFLTKTRKYFLSSVVKKKESDDDKNQLEPDDENDFFQKLLLQTVDNFTLVNSDEPPKIWKFIADDDFSSTFVKNLRNHIFALKNDKTENNEHSFSTVLEWQKYFTEQALHGKRPRLIVTIATDYCSPMICGFIRSHHAHSDQQKSIIIVFAPVGTSAHDHFAFDRMVDLCNHHHRKRSSHTIPEVLWHRNIVETEMGFPATKVDPFLQDFHFRQQSDNENHPSSSRERIMMITPNNIYKYRYVIDEREAQELFLEAAAALTMSSSSKLNSEKNEIDIRRDSLKRFSKRDSVDPDFFTVSPTQFLFEPVTQSFIFHFHHQQKEENQHLLSFYQDSFFSRHRHPILQHHLPSSLNSIEWLSNEVYKIKSLPPDDIPPTLNTKAETAKFKVWYACQQQQHQNENTKQHHHIDEQKQKELALEKFLKNKMKQLKKLKRIGNVNYPRFGYRTEESGSSMVDLPVKVVEGGDGGKEEFQKEVRKVLRAAQNDRKLFQLYKENKKACNRSLAASSSPSTKEACQQRDVLIPRIKQTMIDFENNNDDKNSDGDDPKAIRVACENDGDTTSPQMIFFHYPWVRDNIYHTFNDNFLPFINAMRKVVLEKKILNKAKKLFICPVGVEVLSKSNNANLCINDRSLFRFKFVQLYSSRSNTPLPVFNLLFENLFGKENILDLGEGKSREKMLMMNEKEESHDKICSFSTAKTNNKKNISSTIVVWGRPPRSFSASSRDVAPYFLSENDENQLSTMALTRAFIRMMLLKRERKQQKRQQNNKNKQNEYTKWNKENSDDENDNDKDDSIRIVYLERKSNHKRVFHSDLALLAMLASYPELHHCDHHKKVQVKTCCEGMSFLDQAELISGADILVGVHGAGLLNLIHLGNDLIMNSTTTVSNHQQPRRQRQKKRLFSPLVVHISSKRLNYHEQTVIERLALMTSKALEEEGEMMNGGQFLIEKDNTDEEKVLKLIYHDDRTNSEKSNDDVTFRPLRYMTTRTLVAAHDSAQHWSDSFDLPMEEIEELVHRIFERFLSGV